MRYFTRVTGHFTNLRDVANGCDNGCATAIHDHRTAQDNVMRVGFFMCFILLVIVHINTL